MENGRPHPSASRAAARGVAYVVAGAGRQPATGIPTSGQGQALRALQPRSGNTRSRQNRRPRKGRLVGALAAGSPGRWLALEIERHCSPDQVLQGSLIDLVAFVDVDGAPDIPFEAGVE